MSESHDETYVAPDPPEIPPPALILIVVAAIAAEVSRPKNKRVALRAWQGKLSQAPPKKQYEGKS